LFVLFDSNVEPSDDAQYRWLENVLENCSTNVRHRFLFMHHQPIHWEGDGKSPIWEDRYTRLFELLAKYNVHYVFTGHWHGYHREERAGTVFVVNGRGGDFDHDQRLVPCYFTVVDVRGDSIEDKCIELPPRAWIVVQSKFKAWFIADMGVLVAKNYWISSGILLSLSLFCVFLIRWRKGGGVPEQTDPEKDV